MNALTLEQTYTPNPVAPLCAAIAMHFMLFVLNPTILKRGVPLTTSTMAVQWAEHLPTLAPEIPKPLPVQKPVEKKPKKSGLAPKVHPKPKPKPELAKHMAPAHKRPFVSKIDIPKFVPRESEDALVAASPLPGPKAPARERMIQAAVSPPMLHTKSRGLRPEDVHVQLTDRSSLAGVNTKTMAVPIAEETGPTAVLPPAPLLPGAKGAKGRLGYRLKPGDGIGSGELSGQGKSGYHGVVKANRFEEGDLAASGATAKTISGQGFEITGTIGDRKILARTLPEYPRWAEEKGITAVVQIYFTVRPDGTVRSTMRVQRSSGYSELDELAKHALMQWRFSPAAKDSDENLSWGVITFRFTLN